MVTGSARETSIPNPTPDLESARAAFLGYLASFNKDSSDTATIRPRAEIFRTHDGTNFWAFLDSRSRRSLRNRRQ